MKSQTFKEYIYFLFGSISSALTLGWLMNEPKVWLFVLGIFFGFLIVIGLEVFANMMANWINNDS